ncbi:MAG: hypothetical protein AAGN35_16370 [Bacteroidota bacterium]
MHLRPTYTIALLVVLLSGPGMSFAQIGIGTTNPHPSTMLHITSGPGQNKGVLLPGMPSSNLAVLDSTQNITNGLIIFDQDLQRHYYFHDSPQEWRELDHDWIREDVHGASASIGTNLTLGVSGNVGIGTTNSSSKLSVAGNMEVGTAAWVQDSTAPSNALIVQTWIGIGTSTRNLSYRLTVNGNAQVQGDLDVNDTVTAGRFKGEGVVPPYGIIMYSGPMNNFNSNGVGSGDYEGWQLCNGLNSSPDLRGQFVVGWTNGVNNNPDFVNTEKLVTDYQTIGNNGGEREVTLDTNQIPEHTHKINVSSVGNHRHATVAGSNASDGNALIQQYKSFGDDDSYSLRKDDDDDTPYAYSSYAGGHTHTVNAEKVGGGDAHENRPPFYVLAFIMKRP